MRLLVCGISVSAQESFSPADECDDLAGRSWLNTVPLMSFACGCPLALQHAWQQLLGGDVDKLMERRPLERLAQAPNPPGCFGKRGAKTSCRLLPGTRRHQFISAHAPGQLTNPCHAPQQMPRGWGCGRRGPNHQHLDGDTNISLLNVIALSKEVARVVWPQTSAPPWLGEKTALLVCC